MGLDVWASGRQNGQFRLPVRIINMGIDTAPSQRIRQVAGAIGGQNNQGPCGCRDRAQLGNGDLKFG